MSADLQEMSYRDPRGERNRLKILQALNRNGGKANTSEINKDVGCGSDVIRYHCGILENERSPSQVECVGKEKNPDPLNDTNIYRITTHGEEVLDAAGDDALSVSEAETFAELRSELVEMREEMAELQQAHNDLVKRILPEQDH